jgi:hypothetical protein
VTGTPYGAVHPVVSKRTLVGRDRSKHLPDSNANGHCTITRWPTAHAESPWPAAARHNIRCNGMPAPPATHRRVHVLPKTSRPLVSGTSPNAEKRNALVVRSHLHIVLQHPRYSPLSTPTLTCRALRQYPYALPQSRKSRNSKRVS